MSEEEFIDKVMEMVSELTEQLEKLKDIGICKTECVVKANELVFWLMRYRDEKYEEEEDCDE